MKDREYKDAWQELKDKLLDEYPNALNIQKFYGGSYEFGIVQKLEEIGKYMDKLDGTNEFNNLLSDLEDE